jgi:hypothetical protein
MKLNANHKHFSGHFLNKNPCFIYSLWDFWKLKIKLSCFGVGFMYSAYKAVVVLSLYCRLKKLWASSWSQERKVGDAALQSQQSFCNILLGARPRLTGSQFLEKTHKMLQLKLQTSDGKCRDITLSTWFTKMAAH